VVRPRFGGDGLLFWRLFAVGDQLFGLNTWGAALWRFGVGFGPPDPARGQWFEFSDFAIAGRRILLYDDCHNALWATDGTAPGTYPLQYLPGPNPLRSDSFPGQTNSRSFTAAGEHIFFAANSGDVGQELWALPVAVLPEVCTGAPPPTGTPTPTPMTHLCTGDCDHSGTVTITELIIGVNIRRFRRDGRWHAEQRSAACQPLVSVAIGGGSSRRLST
jgi:hypothetical protein